MYKNTEPLCCTPEINAMQIDCACRLSHLCRVWHFATPWAIARRAPLSLGFSRQEHWSGWPFPSPVHESEKGKVKSLSRARLLVTPQTAAYQAPLSMGFSRQEYWSGVPLPSPLSSFTFHKNHRKLLCCCEHPKWQPVLEFHMQDCLLDLFSLAAVWKQL